MSKKMKFEIGDEVISEAEGWTKGLRGEVVKLYMNNPQLVCVEFKGGTYGHCGPFADNRETCWNFAPHDSPDKEISRLRKVPKPKKVAATQAYRGNGNHEWERVCPGTRRLRVPGGWLYSLQSMALAFVPMPEVVKHKV